MGPRVKVIEKPAEGSLSWWEEIINKHLANGWTLVPETYRFNAGSKTASVMMRYDPYVPQEDYD